MQIAFVLKTDSRNPEAPYLEVWDDLPSRAGKLIGYVAARSVSVKAPINALPVLCPGEVTVVLDPTRVEFDLVLSRPKPEPDAGAEKAKRASNLMGLTEKRRTR